MWRLADTVGSRFPAVEAVSSSGGRGRVCCGSGCTLHNSRRCYLSTPVCLRCAYDPVTKPIPFSCWVVAMLLVHLPHRIVQSQVRRGWYPQSCVPLKLCAPQSCVPQSCVFPELCTPRIEAGQSRDCVRLMAKHHILATGACCRDCPVSWLSSPLGRITVHTSVSQMLP